MASQQATEKVNEDVDKKEEEMPMHQRPDTRSKLQKEIVILSSAVKMDRDRRYVDGKGTDSSQKTVPTEPSEQDLPPTEESSSPPDTEAKQPPTSLPESEEAASSPPSSSPPAPAPPPLMSSTDAKTEAEEEAPPKKPPRKSSKKKKKKKKKKPKIRRRARSFLGLNDEVQKAPKAKVAKRVPEAVSVLLELVQSTKRGLQRNKLQNTPHLLLLDQTFYHHEIKPHIARWALLWLRLFIPPSAVSSPDVIEFLHSSTVHPDKDLEDNLRACLTDHQMKMINLAREWVGVLLPFVLAATNRVTYGLLAPEHIARMSIDSASLVSKNRRLTAIPFIGKDTPSESSEFAHPDVVVGLTICAYRLQGLRSTDFTQFLDTLLKRMTVDSGRAYGQRHVCRQFAHWVNIAGGVVRGFQGQNSGANAPVNATDATATGTSAPSGDAAGVTTATSYHNMLPLQLIDPQDEEHIRPFFELLRDLPAIILFYLDRVVFPEVCQHQRGRLSASGQALGGELLFERRIGFSGTPSSLLPREMGACHYESGTDGRILHTVVSPQVMSTCAVPDDWSVRSLLRLVATHEEKYSALIDCGALVTGLSNRDVAAFLLSNGGLPHKDGGR